MAGTDVLNSREAREKGEKRKGMFCRAERKQRRHSGAACLLFMICLMRRAAGSKCHVFACRSYGTAAFLVVLACQVCRLCASFSLLRATQPRRLGPSHLGQLDRTHLPHDQRRRGPRSSYGRVQSLRTIKNATHATHEKSVEREREAKVRHLCTREGNK